MDGVARVLPKRQWSIRTKLKETSKTLIDQVDYDPYTRYTQAWTWAGQAQELTFRSYNKYHDANGTGRSVLIEPASLTPEYREEPDGSTSVVLSFTLREL